MKQITWVTPDCFVDVDIPIVPLLLDQYDIHWIIIFYKENNRFKESDFDTLLSDNHNLRISFVYTSARERDIKILKDYTKIGKLIKSCHPDLIYYNLPVGSPFALPMIWGLPRSKTIIATHQGEVHKGMKYAFATKILRRLVFSRAKYVNLFSKSQAKLFRETFKSPKVFEIFLALKDFGRPTVTRPTFGKVRFLSFGTINYAKNIELLIDAACLTYERGYRNFSVSINGACSSWESYQEHIKYPEIFENNIRMIDNDEIPNLFESSHYFVQPYRIVSQSGPLKIAFNYNVPVIVSDLPGFTDEVEEGQNGFIFISENVKSLSDTMIKAINYECYDILLDNMRDYTEKNYSLVPFVRQYKNMFEQIISQ